MRDKPMSGQFSRAAPNVSLSDTIKGSALSVRRSNAVAFAATTQI